MTQSTSTAPIHVIGGGLAGSEAAWQIAQAGVPVVLHEMRPVRGTDAHQTDRLAELVCSNSFRADDWTAKELAEALPNAADLAFVRKVYDVEGAAAGVV